LNLKGFSVYAEQLSGWRSASVTGCAFIPAAILILIFIR
jgi:hypothetical protein